MKSKYLLVLLLALVVVVGCGEKAEVVDDEETIFEPVDMDENDTAAEGEAEANDTAAEGEAEAEVEINDTAAEAEEEDPYEGINVKKVTIDDLRFNPKELTVPVGTMVVWEHKDKYKGRDDIRHMLMIYKTNDSSRARSDKFYHGETFNFTFHTPGEHPYIDILYKATMRGTIIVE